MVYKKYIKKNGKLYGPYAYESKRVDGKVVSQYHGASNSFNIRKYAWIFGSAIFVLFIAYFLTSYGFTGLTGQAILGADVGYDEDQAIKGNVAIQLKEGELLPSDSKLVLENAGQSYEYRLSEMVPNQVVAGSFYVEGVPLTGEGEGYGIEGEREIYPDIEFILEVYSAIQSDNSSDITSEISEVKGTVSLNNSFIYNLSGGEGVKLKSGSVLNKNGDVLDDGIVNVNVEGSRVIVETSYSEIEKGFGEDFLSDDQIESISIDLSSLGLILNDGDLMIRIIHESQEIISTSVVLESGAEVSSVEEVSEGTEISVVVEKPEVQPEPVQNETTQTGNVSQIPIVINSETVQFILTEDEKAILAEHFEGVQEKKSERIVNGRLFVKYEIGTDWIENSYDASLSEQEIDYLASVERMKWLKDLAQRINTNKIQVQETTVSETFSVE